MTWLFYALMSALFAALTAILAKIGIKGVDSNLATAIRTIFIMFFAWGLVFYQNTYRQVSSLSKVSLVFLVLSAVATCLSWLFYFKALQIGDASKVAPVDKLSLVLTIILAGLFLKEKITVATALGAALMTAGAIIIAVVK